jgi:hypothetical protein
LPKTINIYFFKSPKFFPKYEKKYACVKILGSSKVFWIHIFYHKKHRKKEKLPILSLLSAFAFQSTKQAGFQK